MKCFWHLGADAVAQCSQCSKGICVNCARPSGDVTYCPDCGKSGVQTEIAQYRRTLTAMKIFCALVTVVGAFISISAISSGADFVVILIVPGAFLLSWCLYWGWSSAWHGFRRVLGGWGVFGSWMFILIVVILVWELVVMGAVLVGLFTGVQRYRTLLGFIEDGEGTLVALRANT
jgi:hypothetical protein